MTMDDERLSPGTRSTFRLGGFQDVWQVLEVAWTFLRTEGWELVSRGPADIRHPDCAILGLQVWGDIPAPLEQGLVERSFNPKGAAGQPVTFVSYAIALADPSPWQALTSFEAMVASGLVGDATTYHWTLRAQFHSPAGSELMCGAHGSSRKRDPNQYQDPWEFYGNSQGKVPGFAMKVLPDCFPPFITPETFPAALEAYHTVKRLSAQLGVLECLGSYDFPPENVRDWRHPTAWEWKTLFRFGPDIPNRVIIPLEERRMPTHQEQADEHMDGSAIWNIDLKPGENWC